MLSTAFIETKLGEPTPKHCADVPPPDSDECLTLRKTRERVSPEPLNPGP